MEGWKDGRVEGWAHSRMICVNEDRLKDGRMEGWKDGHTVEWSV